LAVPGSDPALTLGTTPSATDFLCPPNVIFDGLAIKAALKEALLACADDKAIRRETVRILLAATSCNSGGFRGVPLCSQGHIACVLLVD
jgi:hypothetical protein